MKRLTGRISFALLAVVPAFALSAVVMPDSASAAACASGTGVTTVVGSQVRCASGGSRSAASAFTATGHTLTRVQQQPGFVCKVDGYPDTSCVNTPPADAYWGLFWSDGKTGQWSYASLGVDSLTVPAGGWVGFVFQNSSARTYPGVTPRAAPVPTTTTHSSAPKSSGPSATLTAGTNPTSPSPGPPATQTPPPSASASATSSASASVDAVGSEVSATRSTASKSQGSDRLGWVAAAVAVALLVGMWVKLWRRRRAA